MKLTVRDLLIHELIWNKEEVVIISGDEEVHSKRDRLEFQYEFIDNDNHVVSFIEPYCDEGTSSPYLRIHCTPKEETDEQT